MSGPFFPHIQIIDDFCPEIDLCVESFKAAGYGTWQPNQSLIGDGKYTGMCFMGYHHYMVRALCMSQNRMIIPNTLFSKCAVEGERTAYIHSDRDQGHVTCICYLTDHDEQSGTAFYRHKKTGWREMPPLDELKKLGVLEEMAADMTDPTGAAFEQTDFVKGIKNRALIFRSPLFHSRVPKGGIGIDPSNARLIWVCHGYLE